MSHEINIPGTASKSEIYELILKQIESLLDNENNKIANLANITSVLKHSLKDVIWAGFYIYEEGTRQLVLGPFQGHVACTRIDNGRGVCGQSLERKETLVVPDVEKFPGHIYCDSASKSEIVIPIIIDGREKGVLDLDSDKYGNFDNVDKKYLEKLIENINVLFT